MTQGSRIQFMRVDPTHDTRAGRMLARGALTLTVTSKRSGKHITLRFRARRKFAGRWIHCSFEDASHVFITSQRRDDIATLYPADGVLRFSPEASESVRWTVQATLRHLSGSYPEMVRVAEVTAARKCSRCGRELTDPESIERGFGTECWGTETPSRAEPAFA